MLSQTARGGVGRLRESVDASSKPTCHGNERPHGGVPARAVGFALRCTRDRPDHDSIRVHIRVRVNGRDLVTEGINGHDVKP